MVHDWVDNIMDQPDAPLIIQKIQARLKEEQHRRRQFYDKITEQEKAEFINGEVIVHSPVMKRHESASSALFKLLSDYTLVKELGYVGHEKMMISLTRNDYEPDICFWETAIAENFKEDQTLFPAPNLVVEVLSQGTQDRDRGVKYNDYESHGIQEYWIVDAKQQQVEQYVLAGEKYVLYNQPESQALIQSVAIPGFEIPSMAIFDTNIYLETKAKLLAS